MNMYASKACLHPSLQGMIENFHQHVIMLVPATLKNDTPQSSEYNTLDDASEPSAPWTASCSEAFIAQRRWPPKPFHSGHSVTYQGTVAKHNQRLPPMIDHRTSLLLFIKTSTTATFTLSSTPSPSPTLFISPPRRLFAPRSRRSGVKSRMS